MNDSARKVEPVSALPAAVSRVIAAFDEHRPSHDLLKRLTEGDEQSVRVTGLAGSSESLLINLLAGRLGAPLLVIVPREDDAADLHDDLAFLLGEDQVAHFPARQILPYDFRAPVGEIMGRRISTLAGLVCGRQRVTIASVRSVMEPTIYRDVLAEEIIDLRVGSEVDLEDLIDRLVRLGFHRVPLVEEVGDFAVRGGLIDFFTPGSDAPVRVELYGDEVDSIRSFDVATQRTSGKCDHVSVLPKREIPITPETVERYLEQLPDDDADFIRRRYLSDPELPGLEWLTFLFGLEQGRLFDYVPDDAVAVVRGVDGIADEAEGIFEEAEQLRTRLGDRMSNLPAPDEYYNTAQELSIHLGRHRTVDIVPFRGGRSDAISFDCRVHPALASRLDLLASELSDYRTQGTTFFIATDSSGQKDRLSDLIAEKCELSFTPPVEVANLKGGFVCPTGRFAVLTDHQIFSRYHRRIRRKKFREGVAISDYSALGIGDYVVHTDFGVARYLGLQTITVDKRRRDCLLLEYADKDKLYVPIEEFNRVSKYAGKSTTPDLTPLGGPTWEKLKKKTRKAVEDIAADLIKLYAERRARRGFSFGDDTVWLKQLEASFPFEETPDQDTAIVDVKRDMVADRPMDRLICGDVGYGKTEVAVRAAFKAVDSGKQVAVLVPTTVLAQQHYATFKERMAEFPVRIEVLSRFKRRADQLRVVEDLALGRVDLVIGTHRLLSKDVRFHDLGLLVIDEEHRFGVRHKEKLRQLRSTVDTLSMTATPIPRTLQMSLLGARDMSLINTSPKDRLPILTEIVEFDPGVIATSILREVDRGGQVFFVHNRVQTIEAMHQYLSKLVPQVKIAVAHGQMHERSLEGVMLAFMNRQFDVLLCTSIIESGLDIPQANTIIVNRADRFGLAQLYQIRGRVGRSARRAYAYLVAPRVRQMSPDAVKRLRALEAHSDLGSGFALAMRDLEIRGAGTLLGARQSGFIEEVGFDLYNRLLEEAVAEMRGEEIKRLPETKVETDIETHLPDDYIIDREQKVDVYRRLADCREVSGVDGIRAEVADRFGRMPVSAEALFEAAAVRILAAELGAEKLTFRQGVANIFFPEDHQLQRSEVEAFREATDDPMEFSLIGIPRITITLTDIDAAARLGHLRSILDRAHSHRKSTDRRAVV